MTTDLTDNPILELALELEEVLAKAEDGDDFNGALELATELREMIELWVDLTDDSEAGVE